MNGLQFDHIGLLVNDMAEGRTALEEMFGVDRWTKVFEDPGIGVYVQFGRTAEGPCYELISPRGEASPVATALKRGINILNHVAYLTKDLDADAQPETPCRSETPAPDHRAKAARHIAD